MTLPRRVIPGAYMVQRRVVHRRFYLQPSPATISIFLYCLAYAAKSTGVELHEFVAMTNHYHVVLSDPRCELPRFEQILNSFLARALNRHHGMRGTFWEREPFSGRYLPTDEDLMERCIYVLTNPCSANLVERASEWKGATSLQLEYGQGIRVARPAGFFGDDMPEHLTLELVRPQLRLDLDDSQLRREIRRRVREREQALTDKRRAEGKTVMGMSHVGRQSIHDHPDSPGPRSVGETRSRPPGGWSLVGLGQQSRAWIVQYRDALARWIDDVRNEVFPVGTYLMRVRYGVACASP